MDKKEFFENNIRNLETDHVDELLEKFEYSRLCDKIGYQIVAEFGFKGDKDAVWNQLLEYSEQIGVCAIDNEFLDALTIRKDRLEEFLDKFDQSHNEVHDAVQEFMLTQDMEKLVDKTASIIERNELLDKAKKVVREGNELLHEQKMCLCFNNK